MVETPHGMVEMPHGMVETPHGIDFTFREANAMATSVGAIIAPCQPEPTAASRARKATAVLPDPTSPCRSRTMGIGPSKSSRICVALQL